ncbi:hypothetical protein [Aerolutibacter ruishenii]|uniref:Uncharacterized protein n=1 Tax=Aerolutibacter ruishenii TaxID=686800 RepID=A0A562M342_9GAMM|nr:hypothetical protein [Lysobacter ruishenii]TWI14232.1 hypothetical protein IP93_00227 [Lysobacter ruishenii]
MTTLWSPEQQAWLKALGHRVLVLAGDGSGVDAFAVESPGEPVRVAMPPSGQGPRDVRERGPGNGPPAVDGMAPRPANRDASPRQTAPADVAPQRSSAAMPSRAPGDALERALLRATGQRTRSEARAVLERLGVDVPALRGNPAAKRALWPRLRSLQPRFRP